MLVKQEDKLYPIWPSLSEEVTVCVKVRVDPERLCNEQAIVPLPLIKLSSGLPEIKSDSLVLTAAVIISPLLK